MAVTQRNSNATLIVTFLYRLAEAALPGAYVRHDTGVCEKALLLGEPLPCDPAAETAILPLIWHSEGLSSRGSSLPEECFFHRHR